MNKLCNRDWSYVKKLLLAEGSSNAKRIAEKIKVKPPKERPPTPVHMPLKPSTKPYRTPPDYEPLK